MAYFSFSSPVYLNFLFLIPLVIGVHVWTLHGKHKRAIKFANIEAIERISGVELFSRNLMPMFLHILLIAFLTLVLAGTTLHLERKVGSLSYVLALDASASMSAKDILPSRFFAAKEAAKEFVGALPLASRVGIVSFSGVSYLELEMTEDKRVMKDTLDAIDLKPVGGTNILDAVITSANLMKDERAKAVILLSDGQLNVNTIEEVVAYATRHDVIVHTVGIGTREGGEAEFFISKLDEDALKALAYNTHGKYYAIEDPKDFKKTFDDITASPGGIIGVQLSVYLLIAALLLLVAQWILMSTRWRVIP